MLSPQNDPLGTVADLTGFTLATIYLRGTGTVSAGTIQIEEASDPAYAGTWAPIGTAINANTLTGDKEVAVHLAVGAYGFVRARAATAITGAVTCRWAAVSSR